MLEMRHVVIEAALVATVAAAPFALNASSNADNTRQFDSPCAWVAVATENGNVLFSPSVAVACLNSISLDIRRDSAFIDFTIPFINFQSNLAFLKSPPADFQNASGFSGVDVLAGLAEIKEKVLSGAFKTQFEFTTALQSLIYSCRDSHFSLQPILNRVFSFERDALIVSVSPDGLSEPRFYEADDFFASVKRNHTPSPIVAIDGIPVEDYLAQLAQWTTGTTNADSGINSLALAPGKPVTHALFPVIGPWSAAEAPDESTFTLANGTKLAFRNVAIPQLDFARYGILSGEELHDIVEVAVAVKDDSLVTEEQHKKQGLKERATCEPSTSNGPQVTELGNSGLTPVDAHWDGYARGYFLPAAVGSVGSNYSNIAILRMSSFSSPLEDGYGAGLTCDIREFHRFLASFVAKVRASNKTRLIIDLTANSGGSEAILADTFAQLFPDRPSPSFNWRTRASPALNWIGGATFKHNTNPNSDYLIMFTNLRDPTGMPANSSAIPPFYPTWSSFFGPDTSVPATDNFTRLAFRDTFFELRQVGIDLVTASSAPSTPPNPVFQDPARSVVIVTDGDCHSSCALLAGWLMRDLSVRVVTFGGLSSSGPVQAIGGTKGAGAYNWDNFPAMRRRASRDLGQRDDGTAPADVKPLLPSLEGPPLNIVGRTLNTIDVWHTGSGSGSGTKYSSAPVHFVPEVAHCRLFYTPATLLNQTALWMAVADVAWGGARCVAGSTVKADGTMPDVGGLSNAPTLASAAGKRSRRAQDRRSSDLVNTESTTHSVIRRASRQNIYGPSIRFGERKKDDRDLLELAKWTS